MDKYCLPDNYQHRLDNSFFDDTPYRDEYQDEVYEIAEKCVNSLKKYKILDIGTGSGYKLMKYFYLDDTVGVDLEPTLSFLNKKYPDRKWVTFDEIPEYYYDLVICSDVIEHIGDPDVFLQRLLSLEFEIIVFSTPDRDSMYGAGNLGMPANPCHVREWTMDEFNCYISKYFKVIKSEKILPNTQVLICTKK